MNDAAKSWDKRAFAFDNRIAEDTDPFISIIRSTVPLSRETTDILDIGCGTGTYSLPFANDVRSIRGIDVSPEMIDRARGQTYRAAIGNAQFSVIDWASADPASLGRYPLVIAHMTPAVRDREAFEKIMDVASGWCFFADYKARNNPTWDEIYKVIGEPDRPEEDRLRAAKEIVAEHGFVPHTGSFSRKVERRWTVEEATTFYIEAVESFAEIDESQKYRLSQWIGSQSSNGYFTETSEPSIGVVYWNMDEHRE